MLLRQGFGRRVTQDVESFRISLHEAVLDAVVHHLDEMASAAGPGMDVTLLGARVAIGAARSSRQVAQPGSERGKDRVEAVDNVLLAADHHAIAPLQAPDPAA